MLVRHWGSVTFALWLGASFVHAPLLRGQSATVLAVFAHPDDERVVGPLLARLARQGTTVHLAIATDGSKGVREHAGIAAGPPLAAARKSEAECAANRLGVQLHLIGLEDAGLASFASLTRLRTELTTLVARIQPVAIITFGPEGGTGHPDHRLVGSVVTEIVQGGERHRGLDLLYASLPEQRLASAPRSAPRVIGVADTLITVRVPFESRDLVAAQESFACHRSQYTIAEMEALNKTMAHVWGAVAYLRPWNGTLRDSARVFSP
jgi:LmbE family N-acetylglucosaminyl deacetylase